MEFEFSEETLEMLYETLCNIELAITRLQERTVQVHSADDFRLSPWGMEKLDAACMVSFVNISEGTGKVNENRPPKPHSSHLMN